MFCPTSQELWLFDGSISTVGSVLSSVGSIPSSVDTEGLAVVPIARPIWGAAVGMERSSRLYLAGD